MKFLNTVLPYWPDTLAHAPDAQESPYESMNLMVYWLLVDAVRQYSSVRCSLSAKVVLVTNTVDPERILYDSSSPQYRHFLVTAT